MQLCRFVVATFFGKCHFGVSAMEMDTTTRSNPFVKHQGMDTTERCRLSSLECMSVSVCFFFPFLYTLLSFSDIFSFRKFYHALYCMSNAICTTTVARIQEYHVVQYVLIVVNTYPAE